MKEIDRKILLIEDDQTTINMMRSVFEKQGIFNIQVATNKEEVDAAFSNEKFDLILMDFMIPRTDGVSMLKEFRKTNHHTPIFMVTSKAMNFDRDLCLLHGANEYIVKPIDFNRLIPMIKNYT